MDFPKSGKHRLVETNFVYEALCSRLERQSFKSTEDELAAIEAIARFATSNHTGRFADGRIENRVLELGSEVYRADEIPVRKVRERLGGRPRILHVATNVYQTGGHSRVLAKWIERDRASDHVLAITHQHQEIPTLLADTCARWEVEIFSFSKDQPRCARAKAIRKIAEQVDRVILHHNPPDVIPLLAFAKSSGVPVGFFNQSHFAFSFGGAVADITINTMPYFGRITERFRFPRSNVVIKAVAGNYPFREIDKGFAKKQIGLPEDAPVAITVGLENYYRPSLGYDFFETAKKVVDECGQLQMLFIGVSPDCKSIPRDLLSNPRVRFLGLVPNPVPYYHAADVCLESFPFPSLGAFVEGVAYGGAFPIPVYGSHESILRINQPFISFDGWRPKDEAEYVQRVREAVDDLPASSAAAARLQSKLQEVDGQWPEVMDDLYSRMDKLKHMPGAIPITDSCLEEDNQTLSQLHSFDLRGALGAQFRAPTDAWLHLGAARKGVKSWAQTVASELSYSKRTLARKLGM